MSEHTNEPTGTDEADEGGTSEPRTVEVDGETYEVGPQDSVVQLPGKKVVKGPHSANPPAYHQIVTPENKRYTDYNTYERRAVILRRVEKAGHPRALGQTYQELADEFAVAKSTIASDMRRLSEYVADNLEREHHTIVDSVFRGAILDLVEDGKKAWAAELAKEWYEWLADMGEVERVAESVDLNINESERETETYEIIEATNAASGGPSQDDDDDEPALPEPSAGGDP